MKTVRQCLLLLGLTVMGWLSPPELRACPRVAPLTVQPNPFCLDCGAMAHVDVALPPAGGEWPWDPAHTWNYEIKNAAGAIITNGLANEPAGLTITPAMLEGPGAYWIHASALGKDPYSSATAWGPTNNWVAFIALKVELDIADTADEADDVVCVNGSVNVKARLIGPAGAGATVDFSADPPAKATVSPASTNMTVGTDYDLILTGQQASSAANDADLIATLGECECELEDFTVGGLQAPLQYKIGTNAWMNIPDPLYVCKDTTMAFKAVKAPTNAGWPSEKPVWGGVVSGSGQETNSHTFSTISTSTSDYKIVTAECGNTVTGRVVVLNVQIKNPIDSDADGQVDDFAAYNTNRTGNAFDYDRGTTNKCVIPCRVQIQPDTAEVRSMFAGKVTAALSEISHAGFTSTLTWDSSVGGDPETGLLVYNSTSVLWEASATFTGLPDVPSNSWGRVPEGLHDLLYGNRTATFTVQNPSGSGTFCTSTTNYEVYFGNSLVINGYHMADTIERNTNYLTSLIAGESLRREIYEKMNCSTQDFEFTTSTKAGENFTMRTHAVEVMDGMNTGSVDVTYYNASASPPIHPRAGDTTYNTNSSSWTIGTYWVPFNTNSPWSWKFSEKSGTAAHDAINNVTPFRGECAGAMEICVFQADDVALGAATFATVHPSGSLGLGDWGSDFGAHCDNVTDSETFVPGDYVYMKNKDDYSYWCTNGYWQGENCLYMGLNGSSVATFSGLGEHRKTETELRTDLKNAYETDCYPHTVTNPAVEIRFTDRYRLITGN